MKTKIQIFGSILFASVLTGCCNDNGEPENNKPLVDITLSRSQQNIVDSQARFAFEFFKQTSKSNGHKNIVISPLSLSIDLAMLANGAGDDTYNDITNAIKLPDASLEELNSLYKTLAVELGNVDNRIELSISNGLWYDSSIIIKDTFALGIKEHYDASIQTVDFSDETNAKNLINQWASQKTNGKINDIFGNKSLNATDFILCNAIYFSGKWSNTFDVKQTQKKTFLNIDNLKYNVETMYSETADFMFVQSEAAEVIRLPYGNKAFSMYVILPTLKGTSDLEQQYGSFIDNIDYDWWLTVRNDMTFMRMKISIPKFNIETQCECKMKEFDSFIMSPDLSSMTDSKIAYLKINQYNNIEVSETGTTAASVTKIEGETSAAPVNIFPIDRPFIFLIEEQSTGAILFMGKVVKL